MSEVFLYGTGGGKGEDLEEVLTEQEELIESLKEALENKIAVSKTDIVPLTVTENGTYTAPEGQAYSPVEVNVAGSGGGDADTVKGLIDGTFAGELNSSATQINNYKFYGMSGLTSADFPNATSIGMQAFYNSGLTSANFPNVTSLGSAVFYYCRNLVSVNLPKITSIPTQLFYSCPKLTSADFPLVTSVGESAFFECAITSVDFPNAQNEKYQIWF